MTQLPPGYQQLVPLDRQQHAEKGIDASARLAFMQQLQSAPVSIAEFVQAARHFPLVFVQQSDAGKAKAGRSPCIPVAVFSYHRDQNLFCPQTATQWPKEIYQPAYLRRWPFYTAALPDNPQESVICVDETGLTPDAPALFDTTGTATAQWQTQQDLIRDMATAQKQTESFCASLQRLELLEPFAAQARRQGMDDLSVDGMWRVNETHLHALPAKELKKLAERGYLARIYAHLMSLDNFARLLEMVE